MYIFIYENLNYARLIKHIRLIRCELARINNNMRVFKSHTIYDMWFYSANYIYKNIKKWKTEFFLCFVQLQRINDSNLEFEI